MKVINAGYEIIKPDGILEHLEAIGRVCYKSEERIQPGSAEGFIKGIVNRGHEAMIEHYVFVLQVSYPTYQSVLYMDPKYINMTATMVEDNCGHGMRYLISGSARAFKDLYNILIDSSKHVIGSLIKTIMKYNNCSILFGTEFDYNGNPMGDVTILDEQFIKSLTHKERLVHEFMTVRFICDRGVSHELVRHRPVSFAQESTRYVNYSGSGVSFVDIKLGMDLCRKMDTIPGPAKQYIYNEWFNAVDYIDEAYCRLIEYGAPPEIARSILPNSTKTEIIMTANIKEWLHIFGLRTEKYAHPQMREIMIPLFLECAGSDTIFDTTKLPELDDIETILGFNSIITEE